MCIRDSLSLLLPNLTLTLSVILAFTLSREWRVREGEERKEIEGRAKDKAREPFHTFLKVPSPLNFDLTGICSNEQVGV